MLFDKAKLETALLELSHKLDAASLTARLNVIGGAALALHYYNRDATADVDSMLEPREAVILLGADIADELGWPVEWLNDKAVQFLPQCGAPVEWVLARQYSSVDVYVAPADLMFALKVRASRGKDVEDIAWLMKYLSIRDIDSADSVVGKYWPGEALTPKAQKLVEQILAQT